MTPETRRQVLKFGIAIDLVILATGIGMLFPAASPAAMLLLFIGAVALSAWKGGWGGALTAMALGAVALSYLFNGVYGSRMIAFEAGAVAATAIITTATQTRRRARVTTVPETSIVAFVDPVEAERERQESRERNRALERAAAEQLEAQRREAKRIADEEAARRREEEAEQKRTARQQKVDRLAAAREAKKKAAEERRIAKERALEEQRRALEDEAKRKLDAERAAMAKQLDERLARERETERLAAEEALQAQVAREREALRRQMEEEARRKLEEERERLRRETEERVAREREALRAEAAAASVIPGEARDPEALGTTALRAEIPRSARNDTGDPEALATTALRAEIPRSARNDTGEGGAIATTALRAEVPRSARNDTGAPAPGPAPAAAAEAKPKAAMTKATKAATAVSIGAAVSAVVAGFTGIFRRRTPKPGTVNLRTKRVAGNDTANRKRSLKPAPPQPTRRTPHSTAKERNPRLLLLEKRRGTADTAVPRLKAKGVEVQVVERWIDAVDELFRFRPDALLVDSELPDFEKVYKSIADNHHNVPIFITGRNSHTFSAPPSIRYAGFVVRPYEPDAVTDIARRAMKDPESLLAQMQLPRVSSQPPKPQPAPAPAAPKPAPRPTSSPSMSIPLSAAPVITPPPPPAPRPSAPPATVGANAVAFHVVPAPDLERPKTDSDAYEVVCFNCRVGFDATDSDWCSCLTKERTLVCTNCLNCFCKAPPAYKEKFWVEAPPRLFERKTAEARRLQGGLPENPEPEEITRPLVLSVEDDEDIQLIVQRVCRNLGYGFIYATNGQDGLELARRYKPNLILSDAFMPKLDGREMCRVLKEEAPGSDLKTVVMTGLYTDTKYRSEALKRFHVDDYLAKPVAVTDLINLLQRHLEGVTGLPVQEDLHELHRKAVEEEDYETDVSLAELLESEAAAERSIAAAPEPQQAAAKSKPKNDAYEVCCFNCNNLFDATRAEWCSCLGRDQTLVCEHCNGCFCKAPSIYKERFWMDAPPSLFERKMIGSKRNVAAKSVPEPHELKRPLILLVEDDENIQLIVRTVVTTMGYGFIVAANGQEGLALAREYNPDLILSDAFMPKLDGREMCRLLKEDPTTARVKAIIMTGLYTDRKYRNEALDYFKVDDYVAKPLAVDDLIKLFKKHLPQEVQATM